MKYVMIRVQNGSIVRELPIIFPNELVHAEVADSIIHSLFMGDDSIPDKAEVVSAGFINVSSSGCYGKSETCKVGSRKQDSEIINSHDYVHGMVMDYEEEEDK